MSDYLPTDVVSEILSKLPARSLMKNRCVCRLWNTLITSPVFIKFHLKNVKANKYASNLLLTRYMNSSTNGEQYSIIAEHDRWVSEIDVFKCPFLPLGKYFRVVGICNGVICLSDDYFRYTYTYIIWNPAVRKYVRLPKPSITCKNYGPFMAAIGFGFDVETGDCKLVRLAFLENKEVGGSMFLEKPNVEIYSLSTGSWRQLTLGVPTCSMVEYTWSQTFLNGKVHWAAFRRAEPAFENVVLTFDMSNEEFAMMEIPNRLVNRLPCHFTIGVRNGLLALTAADSPIDGRSYEVYVMQEYGRITSWTKVIEVGIEKFIRSPLCFWREGGEMFIHRVRGGLASFDPTAMTAMKFHIPCFIGTAFAGNYDESLLLLNEGLATPPNDVDEDDADADAAADEVQFEAHVANMLMSAFASIKGFMQ